MKPREAIADIGIGAIGGYVGTQAMERVSMKFYELEPEEARRQEDEARPGDPFIVAARKTTWAPGVRARHRGHRGDPLLAGPQRGRKEVAAPVVFGKDRQTTNE